MAHIHSAVVHNLARPHTYKGIARSAHPNTTHFPVWGVGVLCPCMCAGALVAGEYQKGARMRELYAYEGNAKKHVWGHEIEYSTILLYFAPSHTCALYWWVMLLLVLCIFMFMPLYASAQEAPIAYAVDCGTEDGHQVYAPFTSFFTNTPLIAVGCGEGEVVVAAGGTGAYVYHHGYIREENSNSWRQFSFSGDQQVGEWVAGTAIAQVPAVRDGTVLAYVCERVEGVWKCGCSTEVCATNTWQHRAYAFPVPQLATTKAFDDIDYDTRYLDIPTITEDDLYLYQLSAGFVSAGDTVTVTGQNFDQTEELALYMDNDFVAVADSATVSSAVFTLPDDMHSMSQGKKEITLKNNGKTAKNTLQVYVSEKITEKPSILHITPTTISQGDAVTITGTGFLEEGNSILTGFGVIDDVPSSQNGTVITFRYAPFTETVQFRDSNGGVIAQEWRAYIGVMHAGGVSNHERVVVKF
jgi:hypothetical protein